MKKFNESSTNKRAGKHGAKNTALAALFAPCLGLAVAPGGCDAEIVAHQDDSLPGQGDVSFRSDCSNKAFTPSEHVPGVTPEYIHVCVGAGGGVSVNRFISWTKIAVAYKAALNPTGDDPAIMTSHCIENLGHLYESLTLTPDTCKISKVCAAGNRNDSDITDLDMDVLKDLSNALGNLRCGRLNSDREIADALDVPCSNQTYDPDNDAIVIDGEFGGRIRQYDSVFAKSSCDPEPLAVYLVKDVECRGHSCGNGQHPYIQSSDCHDMTGSDADVVPSVTVTNEANDSSVPIITP
ncbi:MAG: hypothetical protein K0V04_18150 [Deltaproteobacteria bacterium]|nr:hypothetical protein [Deltaproteobacteria bacterium]